MKITVNNTEFDVVENITLLAFLKENNKDPEKVLVSVNGNVIPKQDYTTIQLKEDDQLDLMAFVGGG